MIVSHRSNIWGAQRELFDLVPGLADRGIAFTLAAPADMALSLEWVRRGLPYVPLDIPRHRGLRREDGRRRPSPRNLLREAAIVATSASRLRPVVQDADVVLSVHVLVAAMATLAEQGVGAQLVVVGEAGAGEAAHRYAEEVRLEATATLGERVRFVGRRHDVPQVLRNLDVLVNASRAEPFGLSILEAQACEVAVVATRAGGVPDFVEDGVTGLLVPPDDSVALAAALARLIGDRRCATAWPPAAVARRSSTSRSTTATTSGPRSSTPLRPPARPATGPRRSPPCALRSRPRSSNGAVVCFVPTKTGSVRSADAPGPRRTRPRAAPGLTQSPTGRALAPTSPAPRRT